MTDQSLIAGEIAYQLTKRLVIDMPTARAAVDAAFAAAREQEAQPAATVKENPFCPDGKSDELDRYLPVGTKLYTARPAALEPGTINGKSPTALSLLEALIDIYNDAQANAPEDRCYVEGAWSDILREAATFIAAQPAAQEPSEAKDAARWRMLPAFFEEYQIDAMKLYRDIDEAIADDAQRLGTARSKP